jgi:hypothetical protein
MIPNCFPAYLGKKSLLFKADQEKLSDFILASYGKDVWVRFVYDDSGAHGEPTERHEAHHFVNGKAVCGWQGCTAKTFKTSASEGEESVKEALEQSKGIVYINPFFFFCRKCLLDHIKQTDLALYQKIDKSPL